MFEGMTAAQASNVRKAISMLIDRTWISETVRLTEPPANTFVPAAMADGNGGTFRENDDAYTYPDAGDVGYMSLTSDVEGAIALLEEAGYKFENGMLSAETPLSFEYLVNPGTQHEGRGPAHSGRPRRHRHPDEHPLRGVERASRRDDGRQLRHGPSGHERRLQRPHLLPGNVHQRLRQQLLPAWAAEPAGPLPTGAALLRAQNPPGRASGRVGGERQSASA